MSFTDHFSRTSLFLIALFVSCTGCQSVIQTNAPSERAAPEMVAVQIRPAYGKAKNKEIKLKPKMTLQTVVNESGAKFRNRNAYIVRTSPLSGERHRLEAQFDSNRRISLETDYAIQPGDRVVITQDTTSSIDRVMQSVMGRS